MPIRWYIACLVAASVLFHATAEAGAVSVAAEAKAVAAELAGAAREKAAEEKAARERAEAEAAAAQLAQRAAQAAETAVAARKAAAAKEALAAAAAARARQAAAEASAARRQADRATAEAAGASASIAAATREADYTARTAEETAARTAEEAATAAADAPEGKRFAEAEKALAVASQAQAAADAATTAAYARLDRLVAAANAADKRAARLAAWADSLEAGADASAQEADKARTAADEAGSAAEEARAYAEEVNAEAVLARAELDRKPVPPTRNPIVVQSESNYYYVNNGRGNSGYQFVQPLTFYHAAENYEYGLCASYVISDNVSGVASGRVATWTDTVFTVARTDARPGGSLRFSLDFSLPTGKAALGGSQHNAVGNEDLMEVGTFGAGFNVTPGVAFTRRVGRDDAWTVGTGYAFRGKYDPDADVADGTVDPGGEWTKSFEWRHVGHSWQLRGKVSHTGYSMTRQDGLDYYREGSIWDASLIYVRPLGSDAGLALYYWHISQKPTSSPVAALAGSLGGDPLISRYWGLMWSKTRAKNTFRLTLDGMNKTGHHYDPLTRQYINGRTRYAWGAGVDVALAGGSKLSFDVQRYSLRDRATPATGQDTHYTGYNFLARVSSEF